MRAGRLLYTLLSQCHVRVTPLCLFAYAGGRCLEVVHGTGRQAMQTATQSEPLPCLATPLIAAPCIKLMYD